MFETRISDGDTLTIFISGLVSAGTSERVEKRAL